MNANVPDHMRSFANNVFSFKPYCGKDMIMGHTYRLLETKFRLHQKVCSICRSCKMEYNGSTYLKEGDGKNQEHHDRFQ